MIFRPPSVRLFVVAALALLALVACFFLLTANPPLPPPAGVTVTSPRPPAPAAVTRAELESASPSALPDLFKRWMSAAPDAPEPAALAAVLSRWLETDPASFRAFVDQLAGLPEDDGFKVAFLARLGAALPLLTDRAASSAYLTELIRLLVDHHLLTDPEAALAWAEAWLLHDALDGARVTAVAAIAASDPQRALALLPRVEGTRRRLEALAAIGDAYVRLEPDAALAWGRSLENLMDRAVAMNGALAALAETAPDRASLEHARFAAGVEQEYQTALGAAKTARGPAIDDAGGEERPPDHSPDLELLTESARVIARALAVEDPSRALDWVATMPETVVKAESTRAVLSAWAEQDPAAAFAYLQSKRAFDAAPVSDIFAAWAGRDPAAASAQALRVEGGTQRRAAFEGLVEGWLQQEPTGESVARWSEGLSDPGERNEMRRALAAALEGEDSAAAWIQANAIDDPTLRGDVLRSTFANLASDSPARAEAALRGAAGLTRDERQRLEEILATLR